MLKQIRRKANAINTSETFYTPHSIHCFFNKSPEAVCTNPLRGICGNPADLIYTTDKQYVTPITQSQDQILFSLCS